jgi:hypothetical protein
MRRGRPTSHDQKDIQEKIFSYYENNIEPISVSRFTGINYKTVLKYYKLWNSEQIESENNDFLIRLKIAKERNIVMLDGDAISLIDEQKGLKSLMDTALQTGNTIQYEKLSKLRLKIMSTRMNVMSEKLNLIGTPTADVIISQKEIQNDS